MTDYGLPQCGRGCGCGSTLPTGADETRQNVLYAQTERILEKLQGIADVQAAWLQQQRTSAELERETQHMRTISGGVQRVLRRICEARPWLGPV